MSWPLTSDLISHSRQDEHGNTLLELREGDRPLSWLAIVPFTLHVGAASVRMDGIAGVGTEETHRNRGYSRRLLEASVERMRKGDAALSMLYGIPNYYPKFGYAVAGPDYLLSLTGLERGPGLPAGWSVRPFAEADMDTVRALYERNTAGTVGAAVRRPITWARLRGTTAPGSEDICQVVVSPEGAVAAYAWRGPTFWYVAKLARETPDALVLAEVMAADPEAADAVLALCRQWGREEGGRRAAPVRQVLLGLPPEGPIAAAAMRLPSRFISLCEACGGSMARVLNVERLLTALLPEFTARVRAAGWDAADALRLETDLGAATLCLTPGGVELAASEEARALRLPQTALAQLALGAFPPATILDRLASDSGAADGATRRLVELLFPHRHQHMHLPDRY